MSQCIVKSTVPPNPLPPRNLQVSAFSSISVTLNWRAPQLQISNDISGYKLVLHEQKFSKPDRSLTVAPSGLSHTFSDLEEFDNYEVTIKSVSVFEFESSLVNISFTTMEAGTHVCSNAVVSRK